MKKNKLIALFAGLSLAFVGSAALAAPSPDTLLVAGYDSDSMAVLYGVSGIDQADDTVATLDCSLVGTFEYTVGEKKDGFAEVDSLALPADATDDPEDTTDDTTFEAETVVTDPDAPDDVTYDDLYASEEEDGKDCLLTSVDIEPNGNGEINHGTIVSTFAHLLKGGNGCLIRYFAQSDFGKEDPTELDLETAAPEVVEEQLEITLKSFETACAKGKDKKVDDDSESTAKGHGKENAPGQQNKVDKADKATGKDGAPGQAKKAQGDDNDSND